MKWVGFPNGLQITQASLMVWLERLKSHHNQKHFVVFDRHSNFCGELFYYLEPVNRAGLDIKFLPNFQGQGLATEALLCLINYIFEYVKEVTCVWTEPSQSNTSAMRLYDRCGLKDTGILAEDNESGTYWELSRTEWNERNAKYK